MLPLRQVRAMMAPECDHLSDDELERLTAQLYALAELVLDVHGRAPNAAPSGIAPKSTPQMHLVPAPQREEAEEWAEIREFEGGQDRAQAEGATFTDLALIRGNVPHGTRGPLLPGILEGADAEPQPAHTEEGVRGVLRAQWARSGSRVHRERRVGQDDRQD